MAQIRDFPLPTPSIDPSYGITAMNEDERHHLVPKLRRTVKTAKQLNKLEAANIYKGSALLFRENLTPQELLTSDWVSKSHEWMYKDVWQWAGQIRGRDIDMPLSASPGYMVRSEIKDMLDDALTQIEYSSYPEEEICVRLHHRMVKTHCFINGNGRHSRIFVNKLAGIIGLEDDTFDWGQHLIRSKTEARAKELYIEALRIADDSGDYEPLIKVAFGAIS